MDQRFRPSPAMVVACLALFVALSGTGLAATYMVSSNTQIAPGTISGHKPPPGRHANIIAGSITAGDTSTTSIQRRVTGVCPAGLAVSTITQIGGVNCSSTSGGVPGGSAGGDLTGTYPNPTLAAKPIVYGTDSATTTTIATTCTSEQNAQATITAPRSGKVVVTANVILNLAHTSGKTDSVTAYVAQTTADCSSMPLGFDANYTIPAGEPSFTSASVTVPVFGVFPVTPGKYQFYVNGVAGGTGVGTDTEQFSAVGLRAEYFPN